MFVPMLNASCAGSVIPTLCAVSADILFPPRDSWADHMLVPEVLVAGRMGEHANPRLQWIEIQAHRQTIFWRCLRQLTVVPFEHLRATFAFCLHQQMPGFWIVHVQLCHPLELLF
jgi:hypothetical protein